MKRYNLVYILLLGLFALVFYVASNLIPMQTNMPQQGQITPLPKYSVQVVLKSKANPPDFWRVVESGIEMAAKEYSIAIEVAGPENESDIAMQISLMETAIAKKPDAIVLAACDFEALRPVCEKAGEKNIKIIALDSNVNYSDVQSYIGTDNIALGKKLAALVDENLSAGEKFGVISHVENSTTAIQRKEGLLSGIKNSSSKLASFVYCDSSTEIAREQAKKMLLENPEITCIVGLNESSALGICYALDELSLENKITVIACDSSEAQIKYIENGTVEAVVIQNPFSMGYLSLQAAFHVLEGEKIKPIINTETVVVTVEGLRRPEYQKLLFPFTDN